MISNEQYDYLKTHQTFAQLTREAFDQLARHIRFRKIAKGQVIFYAQDPRDYFWSTIEMKPHVLRVLHLDLSKDVLAVGISQRTDAASIEKLLVNIFERGVGFKKVLAFEFANSRKFMHLDTVFTMVDYDKFTIHPEIEGSLCVFSVTYENEELHIEEEHGDLAALLAANLGIEKVDLIRCGGENIVAAGREQWNDGSNTLTIAPGFSWCTNEILLPMPS